VCWLLLDRLHAPSWVYGVVGTIFALIWIAAIATLFDGKLVDITDFLKEQHAKAQQKRNA
jgi:hypothetical protein